ncbi:ankyrin repeat domain-containing protein 50-like [Ostrea edulis]|uniref:ankyrin repeat domain-containing protein 50-like n=1 Tax=Ostrea edulis TaxID=37623 RepID=UPI0024AF8BDD|nr:ankyrin repeat domain-containing protein 50-like [Ostrea edulis]
MENSIEENNFLILIQALKFVTEGLKEYTTQGLDDLYNRLRRRVSASGPCTQQCNMNHRDATRWCQTCQNWKKELGKYMRSIRFKYNTKWHNVEISYFSGVDTTKAKDELFRVFIQGQGSLQVTFDIQTMLSLFQNCKYFDIGDDILLLTSIRRVRNYDFAHTEDFKLTNKQLKKDINSLSKLFRHPSIRRCPCASDIFSKLRRLQRNDRKLIESETCLFFNYIKENFITNESLKTLTYSSHEQKTRKQRTTSILKRSSMVGFSLLFIFYTCVIWIIYSHPEMRTTEKEACKVMEHKEPFQLNFDFEFYRSQHGPLIGRHWLLNDLDYLMYSTTRGVLLVAETGYGKSAIVSHLICQNDRRLPGNWIYERIVSYHLCRHDSRRSLSPGLFVKNLAGSFANQIGNFHDILRANPFYEAYFIQGECLKDPEGCFDFLIIESLTYLQRKQPIYIIIIDALDECTANSGLDILTLLERRMKRLPPFIKFLITTRNTSSITLKMRSLLHVYELDSQSPNNTKDIDMVMRHKVDKISRYKFDNLRTKFKTSDITLMVSSASKYARHNMLYLHYAFEVWIQNEYVPLSETPSTFEEFFQYNLERVFGENDEFHQIRGIFEVLCAAEEPISDREILRIADIPKENHIQIWKLFGNEMSHFIKHSDGKISIAHIKLSQYLTNKRQKYGKFYVSEEEGNLKFAAFWLRKVEQQMSFHNIDIVQLALYVSRSKNKSQEKIFLYYGKRFRKEFNNDFFLHRAALSINSYRTMVLLIEISGRDIEKRDNTGNFSSAYLGSAFGNHRTLDALLQHGANIHFVRKGPEIVKRSIGVEDFCKKFAHWEYSLLNVASQNGHLDVVSTLLKHGVNVSYTNSLGLNSFHLAAEYGHIELVRLYLRYFKDTFYSSLDHSLYLSAKKGHYSVVELLLHHGAVDRCLPCNLSQYWTEFHETRLQIIDDMDDLKTVNYVFKDDRRFIKCETALEVSLQNGYDEIVKLLIDKYPSGLKCRESGGRTPLLTAIRFQRYKALKQILLHENARNITCLFNRNRWKKLDLNDKERNEYLENQCPFNSSISHFCAMYGNFETIKLLQTYGLINWSERNPDGDTPLHIASCRGHIKTIKLYEQNHEGELLNVRARNGSTLMHSAATCHRYRLLSYLLEKQHDHVFDDMKMGISHYLAKTWSHALKERNELLNIEDNVKERIIREIFLVDDYNRTPLHYAAVHGNVDYLSFLISLGLEHTAWTSILNMADYTSRIIIELAFANVPLYGGRKTMEYESESIKPHEKFIDLLLGNVTSSIYYLLGVYDRHSDTDG